MKYLLLFIISVLSLTLTKPDPDLLDAINLNINIPNEKPDGIQESKRKEISDYRDMVFDYGNNGNNNGYIKRRFKDIGYKMGKYTKYGRYDSHGKKANPCPHGKPVTDASGSQLFCGRGPNRQDCPGGSSCLIHPADKYAVCCTDETDCKKCESVVQGQKCGQDSSGPFRMNCSECCSTSSSSSQCAQWRCDAGGWLCQEQCPKPSSGCDFQQDTNDSDYQDSDDECVTNGGMVTGAQCVFPFIYRGTTYNGCTSTDSSGPWCSTRVDNNGRTVRNNWGNCPSSCKLHTEGSNGGSCSTCSENVESLSSTKIASLREAMRRLHASSDWERETSIHGLPVRRECGRMLCCVHDGRGGAFLPWHRAYMDSFNSALGTVLPYWDWTTSCFPSIARSAPFSHGLQVFRGRNTNRASSCISTRSYLGRVLEALAQTDFLRFSNQLEDVHDSIHFNIGGSMNQLALSSYDPIFFFHHTFVDLIWAIYQVLKPNVQVPNLGRRMIPFGRTIGQTLSTNRYNLDINSNRRVFGGMTLAQIQNRISGGTRQSRRTGISGGTRQSRRTGEACVEGGNRIFAGFFKKSYSISGIIKFNLCNQDDCSFPGGNVIILGGKKQMPYVNSEPTKVDVTDAVNKAGIDNIKQLQFKVISFTDDKGRPINETIYTPIRIVRPVNGGTNFYGTAGSDDYSVFFNKSLIQPPALRIPKTAMIEIHSPYQKVIETKDKNSYINCDKSDGIPLSSRTPINVNNGTSYFFDDDCKPQPMKAARLNAKLNDAYVSKLEIVKE